ncbi:hypothetical protein IJ103_02225 [Candidatus Saccharibacteria bacterium]|nr:hypothetical protein [Candidatus Saccharibacteria bacterium]MBQ9017036.1 hypothetical protein [Candidatus Saccharibacteria bacterium]
MKETIADIYRNHRRLFVLMVVLTVLAGFLLIFGLLNLKVSNTTMHVGYSDIGSYQGGDIDETRGSSGYVSGRWVDMLTFPILAVVLGVMHNLIAMKLYKKRGEASAVAFVVISIVVLAVGALVLWRLTQES